MTEACLQPTATFLDPNFIKQFANLLAPQLSKANQLQKEKNTKQNKHYWVEEDQYWICSPCLYHSKNAPKKYLAKRKGNFGYVSKSSKQKDITVSKNRHIENELHGWCVDEYEKSIENKKLTDRRNELVGKKIVRNAIYCFKQSLGSADFTLLNLKDFLAERDIGSNQYNIATKNDSRAEFFRLRNVIFDVVTVRTIKFFEKIEDIAVTLDKVPFMYYLSTFLGFLDPLLLHKHVFSNENKAKICIF